MLLNISFPFNFLMIRKCSVIMLRFLITCSAQELLQLGARKIGIVGIPPIGCVPSQRTLQGGFDRGCASDQNQVAQIYNSRLVKEVEKIKKNNQNITLVYIDTYGFLLDMIEQPTKYGKLMH